MKRKGINIKGIAKLEKNELAESKGAGCQITWPDGQVMICTEEFHASAFRDSVVISQSFYL
ncbi:MAG: hypothetical protein GY765_11105 [bacterium]|nr:hypothetical protein [bacterium]